MSIPGLRTILVGMAGAGLMLSGMAMARSGQWQWLPLPAGLAPPPVPADNLMTAAKVELGRRLFYDADLSKDGTLACAGCHEQHRGFADGNVTHSGVTGERGIRNVPGLANVAWRTPLTWTDAGLRTLEQQALVPMTGEHPVEMGMKDGEVEVARRLSGDACYRRMFAAAFPGKDGGRVDFPRIAAALAAFQRTMISFGSPYDRYLAGRTGALSPEARRGAAQFKSAGCASCHAGTDMTDNDFHYAGTGVVGEADILPYAPFTVKPGEEKVEQFRTPPLRNVAVTGPWLHDGSAPTLEAAIRRHAASSLAGADMPALLAFLETLTDEGFLKDARFSRPDRACGVRL